MAHNNKARSATLVRLLLYTQIADIVIFNSLFITTIKLLQNIIKLAVNIAELIKGVIITNFSPTTLNKSSLLRATIV